MNKVEFEENELKHKCYFCKKITELITEIYDKENDEILHVCKNCYIGEEDE